METSQVEVESQAIELATQALKAFCGEISGMFGVDMECQRREIAVETVAGLQKRFKKPVAVNIVDSEGALSGTFQFIFDHEGLFTLGGITTMQSDRACRQYGQRHGRGRQPAGRFLGQGVS